MNKRMIIAVIGITALSLFAKPEFKASGDIEFRFRGEFTETLDDTGSVIEDPTKTYGFYANKLGWNARFDLTFDEKLAIKTRFSNPLGYILETVFENRTLSESKVVKKIDISRLLGISVPRAEIIWAPNQLFNMSAGILEVKNSTALTVNAGAELASTSGKAGYSKRFNLSDNWKLWTNESQVGARVGFNFEKAAVNLTYSVPYHIIGIDSVGFDTTANENISQEWGTSHRFILDAPITLNKDAKMKIIPSFILQTAINYNLEDPTVGLHGGVDFATNLGSITSLKAGIAYGGYKDSDSADLNHGLMFQVVPKVKFGFNTVSLGYSYSMGIAGGSSDNVMSYNHLDFKWGLKVHKNLTLMPRVRAWYDAESDNDSQYKKVRPEFIIKANF